MASQIISRLFGAEPLILTGIMASTIVRRTLEFYILLSVGVYIIYSVKIGLSVMYQMNQRDSLCKKIWTFIEHGFLRYTYIKFLESFWRILTDKIQCLLVISLIGYIIEIIIGPSMGPSVSCWWRSFLITHILYDVCKRHTVTYRK